MNDNSPMNWPWHHSYTKETFNWSDHYPDYVQRMAMISEYAREALKELG